MFGIGLVHHACLLFHYDGQNHLMFNSFNYHYDVFIFPNAINKRSLTLKVMPTKKEGGMRRGREKVVQKRDVRGWYRYLRNS